MGFIGYCLGDAETIKPQGEALRQLGVEMLKLKTGIEQRIASLVPGDWSGDGAQAFKELVDRQMDYVLGLNHATDALLHADNVLVAGLSEAEQVYRQAQAAAARANLDIDDRLVVRPRVVTDQSMADAVAVQQIVDKAVETAKTAQAMAADVFEKNHDFICYLLDPNTTMQIMSYIGMAKGLKGPGPTRPWPKPGAFKTRAGYGTAFHGGMKDLLRPFEGQMLKDGWRVAAVERTVGGTKRVDYMIINDAKKQIRVLDWVTGPTESVAHATKGWQYMNEPDIQALRMKGYDYGYAAGMAHPDHLQ